MKRTIVSCDICGSEKNVKNLKLPVYRTFDTCDGRTFYETPHIEMEDLDICEECLSKCTNIHDKRVMGYGDISITPIKFNNV